MTRPRFAQHHTHFQRLRQAALQAVDPGAAVIKVLRARRDSLRIGDHTFPLTPNSRLFLVAFGKAAPSMVRGACERLGDRLTTGLAAVPHGTIHAPPERVTFLPAGHPLPDRGSLTAGMAVCRLLAQTRENDVVLVLASGGGSAMLEQPRLGVRLADLRWLNVALIGCGAPIEQINLVRMALSNLKGGGLTRLAAPARVVSLVLSDVVGDRLSIIGSGPTVLRRPNFVAARRILRQYGLWTACPASIVQAISGAEPAASRSPRPIHLLIGSNRQAVTATVEAARRLGFRSRVVTHALHGEARLVGAQIARRLRAASPGSCLILGGETTVSLRNQGRGGRNQELALAAAIELDGMPDVAVMSLATDGIDGPTDAAGAVVTGATAGAMRRQGLDPLRLLAHHNAYAALEAARALLRLGPTGTNVGDIIVGLRYG
jgi:hydroxypyruvate reductase